MLNDIQLKNNSAVMYIFVIIMESVVYSPGVKFILMSKITRLPSEMPNDGNAQRDLSSPTYMYFACISAIMNYYSFTWIM